MDWQTRRRASQGFYSWAGQTPLHYAALRGHEAVVVALLTAKADKEAKDPVSRGR